MSKGDDRRENTAWRNTGEDFDICPSAVSRKESRCEERMEREQRRERGGEVVCRKESRCEERVKRRADEREGRRVESRV